MITYLYSMKDKVGKEFTPLYEAKNDETAIRGFLNACNDQTKLKNVREDLELYQVARVECDEEKAKIIIISVESPRRIAKGIVKEKKLKQTGG